MYIHKYKPRSLSEITYNKEFNNNISKLSKSGYINNMILHGVEGSGKKTFLMSYLAGIYGDEIHNIRTNNILNSDVKYRNSNYHIEIDLGQHSSKNKRILVDFIKLYSSTLNVVTEQPKLVILYNADDIPSSIQLALRRIIEIYSSTARFIFVCKFKNKIIEPILSRLFCLRVRGIVKEEAQTILVNICFNEKIETTDEILNDIIWRNTKYNYKISIRDIVNDLNLSYIVTPDGFKYEKHINDFNEELDNLILSIKKDKLTDRFYQRIKDYIDKHMLSETSYTDILKYTLYKLLEGDFPDETKYKLIDLISTSKIYMCNKPTLYLEYIMFSIVKIIR
tara:strand:- start:31 stop:1041 length:1011 start_codon:yes stop_codon:yes gene_type:complete